MSTVVNMLYWDDSGPLLVPAARIDLDAMRDKFQAGEILKVELTRPRSVPQNKLFHSLMEFAFDHRRAGPDFATWRHLKSWVLCELGHCEEYRFEPEALTPRVAAALRKRLDFVVFTKTKTEVIMRFANSVAFNQVDSDEMQRLTNDAFDVVVEKLMPGTTVEELYKELGAAGRAHEAQTSWIRR